MKRVLFFFLITPFCVASALAQTTVTGVVKDVNGEPLAGASVTLKGTSSSVGTDDDGRYSLVIRQPTGILVFTFIGLKSVEVNIAGQSKLDVVLDQPDDALSEVVVIGYGSQSRQTTTTAITKVDDKVLQSIPYSNAASALQGTVSGVRVQTTTGQPGAAPRVIVRGGTSINNPNGAAPLYIIDGIQRTDMNNINPNDIESMQVLKDAASTAIYGARGSNGVVIITTKSGRAGTVSIDYRYDVTRSETLKRMEFLSAEEYLYFQRKGIVDGGSLNGHPQSLLEGRDGFGTGNDLSNTTAYTTQYLTPQNEHKLNEGWQSMPDPVDPTRTLIFKETDWQDVLFKNGISHNHALTVSGGSDRATFNAGLGYLKNDGHVLHSDYERLSMNMNGLLRVRDNINVTGRLLFSNTGNSNVVGNPFYRTMGAAPTMKYTFEDGTLAPGSGVTMFNPEYHASRVDAKNSANDLTIALGGQWEIIPGLKFVPQVSMFQRASNSRSFQKSAYLSGPTGLVDSRNASGGFSKILQYQADVVLNYAKSFLASHNIEANAGFSYFTTANTSLSASGRGAASDLIPTLNASAEPVSVSGAESHQVIAGYFGRVNYDYDQRYLLSVSARYDGASNLGDNHKWGLFPGVSAGWNIHREPFWTLSPTYLSAAKIRASYGVNGNISGLGAYQAQGQYSVGGRYGGSAAITNTGLANQELKWEQSKTFDVGLDLAFLEHRVTVLFDYYQRVTDNLLTSMSLPYSTGFGSVLTNLGSLENKGVELELTARILPAASPFQWQLSFNAAKVKNKILELPFNGVENNRIGGIYVWDPAKGDYGWLGGLQEGGNMGDMYAYEQLNVFATDAEAASAPIDMIMTGNRTKYGGDVNWLDADANGIIDERDRVYVGNPYPTWTGGFSNTFNYKNIDLYVRMDYMIGHTIYNYLLVEHMAQTHGDNSISALVRNSWQNQGDVTDIPRYLWFDRNRRTFHRGNSFFYEKGDYLALREITLSYTVPSSLTQRIKLSGARVSLTGNNVHYFTKYRGLSPEDGGQDGGRYPVPRVFMLGINLTL